ncbi:ImmA/IrrE family metallo-endopeptidase [Rummeliibacillus pycnus]|uniref:ImmA/IrrE family metallo-endopeptidase n=1 Tax=Rummeliibacillus pycnus TaxID=101070 RepID=UPI0037CA65A1
MLKSVVKELVEKYNTNNPYEIAECKNIIVINWDLHEEIRGYYKYDRRNRYIVINGNLPQEMQRVVCAHELGHAILHTRYNTPFMRQNTFFSVSKIEIQANTFAAELLISDESVRDCKCLSINQIAALHNVPTELVKMKCKGLF